MRSPQWGQDAGASDLKGVGHIGGREARHSADSGAASAAGTYTPSRKTAGKCGLGLSFELAAFTGHSGQFATRLLDETGSV